MSRSALALAVVALCASLETTAHAQPPSPEAPAIAVVPLAGAEVDAAIGQPVLDGTMAALTVAAPSRRFALVGDAELVAALGACTEASCRAPLVEQTGAYAVILVRMERVEPLGAIQLGVEAVAAPSGESLGEPAQIQLPVATAANAEATQAVLGAILEPVAAALPEQPAPPPTTARVRVAVNADGATVTVDGEVVGETPLAVLELEPGSHTVAIEASGYEATTRTVDVAPEGARLDVYLEPTETQAADLARRDAADADTYADAPGDQEWWEKWWVWTAVGAGALVVTAMIVGIAIAAGSDDDAPNGFPVPPLPAGDM